MTQLALNVNLVVYVHSVKLVMLLIKLQNNVFFVMDVFPVMDPILLNVQDVFTPKF